MKKVNKNVSCHYKMYKAGKKWVVASLASATIMSFTYLTAQANLDSPAENATAVTTAVTGETPQQLAPSSQPTPPNQPVVTTTPQVTNPESQPAPSLTTDTTTGKPATASPSTSELTSNPTPSDQAVAVNQPHEPGQASGSQAKLSLVNESQPVTTATPSNESVSNGAQPTESTAPETVTPTAAPQNYQAPQSQFDHGALVKLAVTADPTMMTSVVPDPTLQKAITDAYNQSFYPSTTKTIEEITLEDMKAIQTINLPSFGSSGNRALPQTFAGIQYCTNLKYLFINGAGSTDIPAKIDFSAIGELTGLERLDFSAVPFTTDQFPDLSKLTSLKILSINQNTGGDIWATHPDRIDNSIFNVLKQCHNLTSLNIIGTNVDSLADFAAVKLAHPNLTSIDFSRNRIKNLNVLRQNINLDNVTKINVTGQVVTSAYSLTRDDFDYNSETNQLTLPFSKLKDLIINPDGSLAYPTKEIQVNYNGKWVTATLKNNAFVINGVSQSDFANLTLFKWRPAFLSDDYKTDGIWNFGGNAIGQDITVATTLPVNGAEVTVKYVDENGVDLVPAERLTGDLNTPYTTTAKDLPGYSLKQVVGNPTGTFTDNAQTVTYVYQKVVDHSSIAGHDVTIHVNDAIPLAADFGATATAMDGSALSVTLDTSAVDVTKPGSYPVTITAANGLSKTVYVHVLANQPVAGAEVTVKYVDENGNEIAPADRLSGTINTPYTTTAKDLPGYSLKQVVGNPTGTFTDTAQAVTYVYQKVVDHSSIAGHDVTIHVNDAIPSAADFGATATAMDGSALPVTLDTSAVDVTKPGSYPVTITAANGLSKTVYVHVLAQTVTEKPNPKQPEQPTNDPLTEGAQDKHIDIDVIPRHEDEQSQSKANNGINRSASNPEIFAGKASTLPTVSTAKQQTQHHLPATGQAQNRRLLVLAQTLVGLSLLLFVGLKVIDRRKR
ncbi:MucBP domain-containing protein [Fructilactobacillus ixorae]|uniref:MucBP domain-containing protein n=1 Tax=Fructilactobacillus ixorae TaxID=1750535 RepID=A0ABY5C5J3_9LACO|nr:MucBP domain-containing protein [Fructilactobacillus ixorae]USS93458.1 MucBP domain-containing protein [Fructilactobacillus ixorae]